MSRRSGVKHEDGCGSGSPQREDVQGQEWNYNLQNCLTDFQVLTFQKEIEWRTST